MKWFVIGTGVLLFALSLRAMKRWHYERWLDVDA